MTQAKLTAGDAVGETVLTGGNDGTLVVEVGAAGSKVNAISVGSTGVVALTGQVVSASVTNTVTNKVAIVINGTTYYLLASTSGA